MGRGRKVILEGGKRPGEERPSDGVNNAGIGERIRTTALSIARCEALIAEILGAATSRDGKRQGGRRDPRGARGDGRGETSEGWVPMDDPA